MEIFDTHFHLDPEDDFSSFLQRSYDDLRLACSDYREVPSKLLMLCAGGSYAGSLQAMEFADYAEEVWFSCGVHPHDAAEYHLDRRDFSIFKDHRKLLAIGEIGLDYFYGFSDRDTQLSVLQEFLDMALDWDKPAMLHLRDKDNCRQAYDDALALLSGFSNAGGRFVIHCYAGNQDDARKFLDMGGYFGVTGMYTFKAAHNIRETISIIPDDRLLIETDSPYLAPVPYRGRNNTPGMVALVAASLGASRQLPPEASTALFTANGKRFYRIKE